MFGDRACICNRDVGRGKAEMQVQVHASAKTASVQGRTETYTKSEECSRKCVRH